MEGPTSSWGSRNRITCLTLQEHDDNDDDDGDDEDDDDYDDDDDDLKYRAGYRGQVSFELWICK